MKKNWEVHVWRSVHGNKSVLGNWYEGRFRWFWVAYVMARLKAVVLDSITPDNGCCYNVHWGIKEIQS